jgi:hypothetical protein
MLSKNYNFSLNKVGTLPTCSNRELSVNLNSINLHPICPGGGDGGGGDTSPLGKKTFFFLVLPRFIINLKTLPVLLFLLSTFLF